jgi:hypothetical protein
MVERLEAKRRNDLETVLGVMRDSIGLLTEDGSSKYGTDGLAAGLLPMLGSFHFLNVVHDDVRIRPLTGRLAIWSSLTSHTTLLSDGSQRYSRIPVMLIVGRQSSNPGAWQIWQGSFSYATPASAPYTVPPEPKKPGGGLFGW